MQEGDQRKEKEGDCEQGKVGGFRKVRGAVALTSDATVTVHEQQRHKTADHGNKQGKLCEKGQAKSYIEGHMPELETELTYELKMVYTALQGGVAKRKFNKPRVYVSEKVTVHQGW